MSKRSRLTKKTAGWATTITAAGAMAVAIVTQWEGIRFVAYQDVVGVWTVCQGITKGVREGQRFTRDQCNVMFIGELEKHEAGLRKCIREPDIIPEKTYVSFVSWTYNVGVGAACNSTLVKKINYGDLEGACYELPKWKMAGGRVVRGLVNRRADEQRLCFEGLDEAKLIQEKENGLY